MAITTSGTGKESTGGFSRVTGLLKVKNVIVNPTKTELEAYGVSWREPNYEFEDSERGKAAIVEFYFKVDESNFKREDNAPKDIILSTRFYLYPRAKVSQSGLTQYVNKFGSFTYAKDAEAVPSWFEKDGMREAFEGEEGLMNFIKAWGDVRRNDECTLDSMADITKGDTKELKTIQKIWEDHKLKVLVGLKDAGDDKFNQVVYGKEYWRVFSNKLKLKGSDEWLDYKEAFPAYLEEEYRGFNQADVLTYEPKVWDVTTLKSVTPDSNPTPTTGSVSAAGLF